MQKIVNILSTEPGMKNMVFNNPDVKAVKVKLEAGQAAENCVVDAPVLLFVIEGEGAVVIEKETYPLTEGDVTVVPSGKNRHLQAGKETFRVLAVQSHQADKTCGLCALLEDCVNLKI
ncbi:cupin domain-containing protein [Dethiobacter alkaliphilus]|uniref:Cupin 2 conserved barrel domain protein n=2 Tax=Dethiobacter TaxID=427925 RepID=C0GC86_DETAL|nr:cupin domain-containing protein [Dethiobacter alkaliphilus]EEG78821.1 Cupin 2 conserved barrel domain protein [Dethiobacter alkaliphilus AHT 1]